MGPENDDLPASDEQKHLQTALKKCQELEHTLRLSLVQVMLLNRKYCSHFPDPATSNASKTLFENNATGLTPKRRGSEVFNRNTSTENLRLRVTASSPFLNHHSRRLSDGCRPIQMYRSLNSIVLNSNEINVQVIKIRRHFEGVLIRVEYLVRMYCKKLRWQGKVTQINVDKSGVIRETQSLPNFKAHQYCGGSSVKGR